MERFAWVKWRVRGYCSDVQVNARDSSRRLADLLQRERGALADFLVALSEFDQQRCWVELGYTSLFYFLQRELGLSNGAAYHRKVAAELLQRYPELDWRSAHPGLAALHAALGRRPSFAATLPAAQDVRIA